MTWQSHNSLETYLSRNGFHFASAEGQWCAVILFICLPSTGGVRQLPALQPPLPLPPTLANKRSPSHKIKTCRCALNLISILYWRRYTSILETFVRPSVRSYTSKIVDGLDLSYFILLFPSFFLFRHRRRHRLRRRPCVFGLVRTRYATQHIRCDALLCSALT